MMCKLALDLFRQHISIVMKILYSRFKCKRCVNNVQMKPPPEGSDCTSDLSQWYHCSSNKGIPDEILSQAWKISNSVSFIFHHRSATVAVEPEPVQKKEKKEKKYSDDDDYCSEPEADNDNDSDYE